MDEFKKRIEKQLNLYAGFDEAGTKLLTLRELLQQKVDLFQKLSTLIPKKKAELTVERIKAQDEFEIYFVGVGKIDKKRAIEEIEKNSNLGKQIIRIEEKTIKKTLKKAKDLNWSV